MKRAVLPAFVLAFGLPFLCGVSLRTLNSGPSVGEVRRDFQDPDKDVRHAAIEWTSRLKSPALVDDLVPLLKDERSGIRRRAAQSLGSILSPRAIPHLYEAAKADDKNRKEMIWNMSLIQYPQALPLLLDLKLNGPVDTREEAGFAMGSMMWAINKEVAFYSLTDPAVNDFGRTIHSQAVLWDEGRNLAAMAPSETFQPDAAGGRSPE